MTISNAMKTKRILRAKSPKFMRHAFHRKANLSPAWRKPRGLHNKQKDNKMGSFARISSGYRTPLEVRDMHSSGLMIVRVSNLTDIESINPKTQGAVIASIGLKKQLAILDACTKKGIRVLNHKPDSGKKLLAKRELKKAAAEAAREAKSEKAKKETKKPVEEKVVETAEEKKEEQDKIKEEVLTHK